MEFDDNRKKNKQLNKLLFGIMFTSVTFLYSPYIRAEGTENNAAIVPSDLDKKAKEVTVEITAINAISTEGTNRGSGVIIKTTDGSYAVITNYHVIKKDSGYIVVIYNKDTTIAPARRDIAKGDIKKKESPDLALLKFKSDQIYPVVEIGKPLSVTPGQNGLVTGFPGQRRTVRVQFTNTPVNSEHFINYQPITYKPSDGDGKLEKGMSGGSILDEKGQLIGIHQGKVEEDKDSDGVGVPVQTILQVFQEDLVKLPEKPKQPIAKPKPKPIPARW